MESMVGSILNFGDGKIRVVCVVLTVIGILVVLHRMIKLGLSILAMASLVAYLLQGINTLKSDYNFELDNEHISVVLNEKQYELKFDDVDKVEVYRNGDTSLLRLYKDNEISGEIAVPNILCNVAKPILEKQHIDIVDIDKK